MIKIKKKISKIINTFFKSAIGSDEVGTGDFFGPVVVTAAYVNKKDISFLKELGVNDSKKDVWYKNNGNSSTV